MLMQSKYKIENEPKQVFTEIDRIINKLIAIGQSEEELEARSVREIIESCQKIAVENEFIFRDRC